MDKAYSSCGEHFVDNLGDLIDQDGALEGDEIFVGEIVRPNIKNFISIDRILEDMNANAYEFAGDFVEEWPDLNFSQSKELKNIIADFIEKQCPPKFYHVKNVVPYILTSEDVGK